MLYINKKINQLSLAVAMAITLSACGGGGSDHNNSTAANPSNPTSPTTPTTPTTPNQITCVNGIPQNLKTTGSGIFSEEIFSLEVESNDQDQATPTFYSNKISNGVLYQTLTSLVKNSPSKIDTQYLSQYNLTRSKLDTSFKQTLTSSGFPLGYLISQDGDFALLNQFSDECTIQSENQIRMHIQQIDISGKTIADLFKYYDYPNAGNAKRYISSDIANVIKENNKDSLDKLLLDQTKFPAGSKISYIDQSIFNSPSFSFRDSDLSDYKTIDEFKANTKLPTGYIWKDDQFAGLKVAYPVNATTGVGYPFTDNYNAVELNGKIYEASYFPAGDLIHTQMDPSEQNVDMSETYFNKTALTTFVDALNKVL